MYTSTGEKILGLAQIMLIVGIILSVIFGFLIGMMVPAITYDEDAATAAFFVGVIVAAIGCLVSYLSYLLLAGYGELIDNTYETHRSVEQLRKDYTKFKKNNVNKAGEEEVEPEEEETPTDADYAKKLKFLLSQFLEGKIDEYELNERTSKLNEIYGGQK